MSKKAKKPNSDKHLKIVCFGGGNVVPSLMLEPLKKKKNILITGITSMVDSGGATGQLRSDFGILPPGDIRRHILALSSAPKWKKDLWQFRFGREEFEGGHKGHNFANIFIAGLEYVLKDYGKVIETTHDFMEVENHKALPSTIGNVQLVAELENGEIIRGEDEIDVPKKHDPNLKIKRIFLEPKAEIFPGARKAILEADVITLGPGDFYSSVLCCLLPEGMKAALGKTKAKKVLIVGLFTKLGETNNFSVSDFANETERYMGCPLDFVVYNSGNPDEKIVQEYMKKNPLISGFVKADERLDKNKFIGADLLGSSASTIYEPDKVIKNVLKICK